MHDALNFSCDAFSTFQFRSNFSVVLQWILNSFSKFVFSDRMLASFSQSSTGFSGTSRIKYTFAPPSPSLLRMLAACAAESDFTGPRCSCPLPQFPVPPLGGGVNSWTHVNHGRCNQTNNKLIYDKLLAKTKCIWLQFSIF